MTPGSGATTEVAGVRPGGGATMAHTAPQIVLALSLVVAALGARFAVHALQLARHGDHRDFAAIYTSAVVWREGGRIYDAQPEREHWASTENPDVLRVARRVGTLHAHGDLVHVHVFSYPPFTIVPFAPFTVVSFKRAAVLYEALSLLLLALAAWCLGRFVPMAAPAALTLAAIALVFEPLDNSLGLGQINQLILALLCVFAWALVAGRDTLAGLSVGLATALRLHPGLLIAYLAWRRRWCAFAWAAGTAVACSLIAVPVVGWAATMEYATVVAPKYARAFLGLGNLSISGWLATVGLGLLPRTSPALWRTLGTLASAALVLGAFALIAPPGGAGRRRIVAELGLLVTVLALATPNTTINHLVFLFLPLAVLVGDVLATQHVVRAAWLAVAVALVGGVDDYYMHPRLTPGPQVVLAGIKTYGLVIIAALAAAVVVRTPREAA